MNPQAVIARITLVLWTDFISCFACFSLWPPFQSSIAGSHDNSLIRVKEGIQHTACCSPVLSQILRILAPFPQPIWHMGKAITCKHRLIRTTAPQHSSSVFKTFHWRGGQVSMSATYPLLLIWGNVVFKYVKWSVPSTEDGS